jgi:predicted RNA-binding Zn-ribbon protein involved in translation (DUF1610 family)
VIDKITITKLRSDKSTYEDIYERSTLFCPNCGEQAVWLNVSSDDYYLGISGVCIACGKCHHKAGDLFCTDNEVISKIREKTHG